MTAQLLRAQQLAPGLIVAALVAISAQFLSDHYGAPAMLMAILIGLALNFLAVEGKAVPGIAFAAREVLRLGVALLGLRISTQTLADLGAAPLGLVMASVGLTILFGIAVARVLGQERTFGFLTGGSVAICGASAALAIGATLPPGPQREQHIAFTVISVTLASTLAMIVYPILAAHAGLSPDGTGLLLGATIHDVAQVVGAGFSVSPETGEAATLIKLFRVVLLAPVVMIAAAVLRQRAADAATRPPLVPGFVAAFLVLAAANSAGIVPAQVTQAAEPVTRAALLMAVGAVGIWTSIPAMLTVGPKAVALVAVESLFLLLLVLGGTRLLAM